MKYKQFSIEKLLILSLMMLAILAGCKFPAKQPAINQGEFPKDELPYKKIPEDVEKDFAIVKPSSSLPCWLQSPKGCVQYKHSSDILLTTYINILPSERFTDILKKEINQQLYRDYLIILKNEITKNLEETIGECQGKKEICEELFNDYCINHAPDYIKNKFEYEDQFRSNLNDNRCEYYVLGLLKAHKHQRLKQNIIQYIQKKVPRAYEPVKNPGIKWLE